MPATPTLSTSSLLLLPSRQLASRHGLHASGSRPPGRIGLAVQERKRTANASESSNASGNVYCDCRKCPAGTLARYCNLEGGIDLCGHGLRKYDCRNPVCNPNQAQICSECGRWKNACARSKIGSCSYAKGTRPMCECGVLLQSCKKRKSGCPLRKPVG